MSDDFDFDPDDLFDDFDDEDEDLGGDLDAGFDDSFDEDFDAGFDDEFDTDFADFDEDEFGASLDFIDEEDEFAVDTAEEQPAAATDSGGNSTFVIAAIAMVVVFVLGLLLILFLVLGGFTGSGRAQQTQVAFEATSTQITILNATSQAQIEESATAAIVNATNTREAIVGATETVIAQEQATNQAQIEGSATAAIVNATASAEAIVEATASAEAAAEEATAQFETQQAESITETAVVIELTLNPITEVPTQDPDAVGTMPSTGEAANVPSVQQTATALANALSTPDDAVATSSGTTEEVPTQDPNAVGTMPPTGEAVSESSVQQTATALAELFNATPTAEDIVPTSSLGQGGGIATSPPGDTGTTDPGTGGGEALPDTGLFDDVFGGNPMLIIMLALGLVAVIAISRGVRSANNRET